MDSLDCRSPRRCPTCEHWLAGACELERQLAAFDAPRAAPLPVALNARSAMPMRVAATT